MTGTMPGTDPQRTDPPPGSMSEPPTSGSPPVEPVMGADEVPLASSNNSWNTVTRRKSRKRKSRRELQTLVNLDELFNCQRNFVKYFNIRFPGVALDKDVNILKTDKDLLSQVGKLEKISQAGRNTLLVEACNAAQATKLLALSLLDGNAVVVEPHKLFNGAKGVIRSSAFNQCTEEELTEHLRDQGVSEVRRIRIKRDGTLVPTNTYIITFTSSNCPRVIKLTSWHYERVEEYTHRPQQCFKCQNFGHVAKFCRKESERCANCGQWGHTRNSCVSDTLCCHCGGCHISSSRTCQRYLCESEIVNVRMKARVPRSEAVDRVLSNHPEFASLFTRRPLSEEESARVVLPTATGPVSSAADSLVPSSSAALLPPTEASSGRAELHLPSSTCTSPSRSSSGLPTSSHGATAAGLSQTSVTSAPAQSRQSPLLSSAATISTATRVSPSTAEDRPKPAFVPTLKPKLITSPGLAAAATVAPGPSTTTSSSYSAVVSKRKTPASPTKTVSTPQKAPKRRSSLVHDYESGSDDSPTLRGSSQKIRPSSQTREKSVSASPSASRVAPVTPLRFPIPTRGSSRPSNPASMNTRPPTGGLRPSGRPSSQPRYPS